MKKYLIIFLSVLIVSCESHKCDTLNDEFNSYKGAISSVIKTTFNYTDELDTSKSSWIREANYYSCDNAKGYLIIETDSQNYIYKEVPKAVWEEFKQANSFGRYYNSYIKGNYKLSLKN